MKEISAHGALLGRALKTFQEGILISIPTFRTLCLHRSCHVHKKCWKDVY